MKFRYQRDLGNLCSNRLTYNYLNVRLFFKKPLLKPLRMLTLNNQACMKFMRQTRLSNTSGAKRPQVIFLSITSYSLNEPSLRERTIMYVQCKYLTPSNRNLFGQGYSFHSLPVTVTELSFDHASLLPVGETGTANIMQNQILLKCSCRNSFAQRDKPTIVFYPLR